MYDELIKRLRMRAHLFKQINQMENCIMDEAADAIEELSKKYLDSEADNTNLTGWLAEEHAKHLWIPVTERLPKTFKSVLTVDKFGLVVFNWISGDGKNWSNGYHITHWMPLPQPPKEA